MGFLVRWLATAVAVAAAVWIIPGVYVGGTDTAWVAIVLFALVLSLVNTAIKPLVKVLSLPITVLTLGIFSLIINTLLLYLAAWISAGLFGVGIGMANFISAFFASIIISIVSALVNGLFEPED